MHSAFGKAPAVEGKSDSLDPLRYLWIGRQGRVHHRGKHEGSDSYSEAHRHATLGPLHPPPPPHPSPRFLFLALLCILAHSLCRSHEPASGVAHKYTRTQLSGVARSLFTRRLKNRTVIYGTALDGGIPLMVCLNVSILSLILLSAPASNSVRFFEVLSPFAAVNRGYFSLNPP